MNRQGKPKPEPPPWRYSPAKKKLRKLLEDPTSVIHKLKKIKDIHAFDPIFTVYKIQNFTLNYNTLLKAISKEQGQLCGNTKGDAPRRINSIGRKPQPPHRPKNQRPNGPPREVCVPAKTKPISKKKDQKLDWKTSFENAFLRSLLLDTNSSIQKMGDEEIYGRHKGFQKYPLKNFKVNLRNLKKKIASEKKIAAEEYTAFKLQQHNLPRNSKTCRGYPHWNNHPAKVLLKKDVESGLANTLSPKDLYKKRAAYQEFPPGVFRYHIYQQKRVIREHFYWVQKRNHFGRKKHDEEVKLLKLEWGGKQHDAKIDELIEKWNNISNSGQAQGDNN